MKNLLNKFSVLIIAVFMLTACGELSKNVEKKLDELQEKTESIDSLIREEVDKVLPIDSLIDASSTKLDSIAKEKDKLFEKITQ